MECRCSGCGKIKDDDGFKTCDTCRNREKERRDQITETHKGCRKCKKLKPFSEFKSNRTCIPCAEKESQSVVNRLRTYKGGAKKRNLAWDLTDNYASILFQMACDYCNKQEGLNGIDRQDNSLGYIQDNCVPCCDICNFGKGQLSETEFLNMCLKVTAHRFPWVVPFYSMWMACSSETKNC